MPHEKVKRLEGFFKEEMKKEGSKRRTYVVDVLFPHMRDREPGESVSSYKNYSYGTWTNEELMDSVGFTFDALAKVDATRRPDVLVGSRLVKDTLNRCNTSNRNKRLAFVRMATQEDERYERHVWENGGLEQEPVTPIDYKMLVEVSI